MLTFFIAHRSSFSTLKHFDRFCISTIPLSLLNFYYIKKASLFREAKIKNLFKEERGRFLSHLSVYTIYTAGFGTLYTQVAGFHRASPSTSLDKSMLFG
jgi:hypothetical protein